MPTLLFGWNAKTVAKNSHSPDRLPPQSASLRRPRWRCEERERERETTLENDWSWGGEGERERREREGGRERKRERPLWRMTGLRLSFVRSMRLFRGVPQYPGMVPNSITFFLCVLCLQRTRSINREHTTSIENTFYL